MVKAEPTAKNHVESVHLPTSPTTQLRVNSAKTPCFFSLASKVACLQMFLVDSQCEDRGHAHQGHMQCHAVTARSNQEGTTGQVLNGSAHGH